MKDFIYALAMILNEMSPYILLGFLFAGVLHVFVKPQVMARHLSGAGLKPVIKSALLGIPLPLCSCGVLPTAVSLRRQGASRGATTSFLIATPQTGVDSIAATYSLLGLPMAILRPVAALAGAVAGGMAVDKSDRHADTGTHPHPTASSCATATACDCTEHSHTGGSHPADRPATFAGKVVESVRYGMVDMVGSVGKWLVIGLFVAALITVFMPDELLVGLSRHPLLAMLAMVALAVPMYVCATGSIPIALSLMLKGLTPGVAFVLLMAGPAANFASVMVLGKTLGRRATAIYVGSVVVTAICFGLIIDCLLPASWFIPSGMHHAACHGHDGFPVFSTVCSAVLVALLAYSAITNYRNNHTIKPNNDMTTTYKVNGMSCGHCKMTVEKAVASLKGVESATANLAKGTLTVDGAVSEAEVAKAVALAGFEFGGEAAADKA